MRFSDIPGHEEAKQRLRQMVDQNRLPHALLIEGPTGTGKFALARTLVQYLHCTHRTPDGEPCGRCPSCRQHQALGHIDTQIVFPVLKKESAKTAPLSDDFLDQIRQYINAHTYISPQTWAATFTKANARPIHYVTQSTEMIRRLALTPNVSDCNVVILWQPEALHPAAANKILKLIEEPLPGTLFVMVSEHSADILPTIYSRLQRITLRRLPDDTVVRMLATTHGLSQAESADIAHIAEGNMVAAETLIDQRAARHDFFDRFTTLMRLAYMRNLPDLRRWADALAATGRDNEIHFYEYAIRMMRENFIYNLNVPDITYLNSQESQFSSRFARFITAGNVEPLIQHFQNAITDIEANGNGKMINFDVAIKVIMLIKNG